MNVNTEKTELALKTASTEISEFVESAELEVSALEDKYLNVIPDASTKHGYAECKTVRSDLMPIKTSLEAARKTLKAPIIDAGKLIDSAMKPLAQRVEDLYKPFESAYREIDNQKKVREERRQKKISEGFELMQSCLIKASGSTSTVIEVLIDELSDFSIDRDVFMERSDDAARQFSEVMAKLGEMLLQAKKIEEVNEREAEMQKREAEMQAKLDRIEAAEKAEKEKAEQAKRDAENKELQQQAAEKARAEEKIKHDADLKTAKELAIKHERERIEREQQQHEKEIRAREQNRKIKSDVHNAILEQFLTTGASDEHCKAIITLIAQRKVPNLTINY